MLVSTRSRVSGEIDRLPLSAYDTVLAETPACRATSVIFTTAGHAPSVACRSAPTAPPAGSAVTQTRSSARTSLSRPRQGDRPGLLQPSTHTPRSRDDHPDTLVLREIDGDGTAGSGVALRPLSHPRVVGVVVTGLHRCHRPDGAREGERTGLRADERELGRGALDREGLAAGRRGIGEAVAAYRSGAGGTGGGRAVVDLERLASGADRLPRGEVCGDLVQRGVQVRDDVGGGLAGHHMARVVVVEGLVVRAADVGMNRGVEVQERAAGDGADLLADGGRIAHVVFHDHGEVLALGPERVSAVTEEPVVVCGVRVVSVEVDGVRSLGPQRLVLSDRPGAPDQVRTGVDRVPGLLDHGRELGLVVE